MLWKYRAKWKLVGMELQIESDDLNAIEIDKRTVADSLLEVINLWLHRANPKPTRTVLTAVTQSKLLVTEAESLTRSEHLVTQAESQSDAKVVSPLEGDYRKFMPLKSANLLGVAIVCP